jgi:hypothetical protein
MDTDSETNEPLYPQQVFLTEEEFNYLKETVFPLFRQKVEGALADTVYFTKGTKKYPYALAWTHAAAFSHFRVLIDKYYDSLLRKIYQAVNGGWRIDI